MREEVFTAIGEVLASGERGALATVVRAAGSTPGKPGARMLLRPSGELVGTLGGGRIEQTAEIALREVQKSGTAKLLASDLTHDLGMCCGGRMEIFVEPLEAACRLHLCGAGHIAAALAPLAKGLGFEVTVVDERPELNSASRFVGVERKDADPAEHLRRQTLGARDWVVIATHDHPLDERALEAALMGSPRYIGLLGSRRKVFRSIARIAQRRGALALESVYAPVGLALGAEGPAEIALSIAAELLALRRGKPAHHMRAVDHPHLQSLLAGEAVPLDAPAEAHAAEDA